MDKEKALQVMRESLGEGDYNPEEIPSTLLLKLGEECAELIQAINKSLNPMSGSFGKSEKILEESGHVLLFLKLLDSLYGKEVAKSMKARIQRHHENPK